MQGDINMISKFAYEISKLLNLDLEEWEIRHEIQSQFSFHFYHFLSCQLSWMKMWQQRIKDIDLVLIENQIGPMALKMKTDKIIMTRVCIYIFLNFLKTLYP